MEFKIETIKPETYKALKCIVGNDHITREPAILDGYCFTWGGPFRFTARPLAVVMPGSTEEVQSIARLCNRYHIKFRAYSTGFGIMAHSPHVAIDLKRMDRILEIDEKNMYAVVEPYCSFAALMYAANEKGLRVYQIGAGPSCSVLANATSMGGFGTSNVSAGFGGRVPLSVEWVLPDGELVRLGSLGSSGEWFTGDGPGISLRSLMRGIFGHNGNLGIFTKVAIRLVPWYGPTQIETYGDPPNYRVVVPENFRVYTLMFPSMKNVYQAMQIFQEEGIVFWCSRRGPFTMAAAATGTNREVWDQWQKGDFQKKLERYNNNISIGVDAGSPEEMAFREELVHKVLDDLGGEILDETLDEVTARFAHGYNCLGAVKGTFRSTGGMGSAPFVEDSWQALKTAQEQSVEIKAGFEKAGTLLADGDSTWVTPLEDFGGHMETPVRFDPTDEAGVNAVLKYVSDIYRMTSDQSIVIGEDLKSPFTDVPTLFNCGGRMMNVHRWIRKLRHAFDPNDTADIPLPEVEKG